LHDIRATVEMEWVSEKRMEQEGPLRKDFAYFEALASVPACT